jgi:hypothetical protein
MVFLMAVSAFAHPPWPYVGGTLSHSGVNEVAPPQPPPPPGNYPPCDGTGENWLWDYTSFGGRIESSIAGDFWDSYAALIFETGDGRRGDWRSGRLGLGMRFRVADSNPNPLKATIGGALTAGWFARNTAECGRQSSVMSPGWLLEGGFSYFKEPPVRYVIFLCVERFDAQFPAPYRCDAVNHAWAVTLQWGAHYLLKR